jgi:hypothetical protein
VCVYTKEGVFLYGYGFDTAGSFHVELNGEILNIYLVRSDISIGIDQEGKVIHVLKIEDTKENSAYWRRLESTERKVGESVYALENNIAGAYARLTVTEKAGSVVIYEGDATGATIKDFLLIGIMLLGMFGAGTILFQSLRKKCDQSNREKNAQNPPSGEESE